MRSKVDTFLKFCEYFVTIRLLTFVWRLCLRRGFQWCGGANTWAVVTGSTDGIGLEYARQLAGKGYNLLLISRNPNKLSKVKEDIEFKYMCSVRVLALDFSRSDIYDTIEEEFKRLDQMNQEIHVLVNNVGIVYPNERPEYMTKIPNLSKFIESIINVNINACTRLTALVLPRMVAKGRGAIINLSSASALYPIPLLSLYSATKVYIDYFSRALHEEYKSKGIVIQCVIPCYVSTNMSYNMDTNLFVPSPPVYVNSALKTVGKESRTAGYFPHRLVSYLYYWGAVWSEILGINFLSKFNYFRLKTIRNRINTKQETKETLGLTQAEEVVAVDMDLTSE
ncbi:unnamed protein product [Oppiella nova]|uniref:Steroid dehydrogenase n=1 Tax=Oppiella nova TaxID=334625 RepID=A0A7R9LIX6_9ACAR|nr:unnamed protein product [Oppiella nova]CAG2164039.1 unnamed protein product [Oppiella nova]